MSTQLISLLMAIVAVALVTTIVGHAESANVVRAGGGAFSGALSAALGSAR